MLLVEIPKLFGWDSGFLARPWLRCRFLLNVLQKHFSGPALASNLSVHITFIQKQWVHDSIAGTAVCTALTVTRAHWQPGRPWFSTAAEMILTQHLISKAAWRLPASGPGLFKHLICGWRVGHWHWWWPEPMHGSITKYLALGSQWS